MSRTFHHAKTTMKSFKGRTCKCCGAALHGYHQRLFCDNACKQKAYRDRSRERFEKMVQALAKIPAAMPTRSTADGRRRKRDGYSSTKKGITT